MLAYTNIDFNSFVSVFRGMSIPRCQMEGVSPIATIKHVCHVFATGGNNNKLVFRKTNLTHSEINVGAFI